MILSPAKYKLKTISGHGPASLAVDDKQLIPVDVAPPCLITSRIERYSERSLLQIVITQECVPTLAGGGVILDLLILFVTSGNTSAAGKHWSALVQSRKSRRTGSWHSGQGPLDRTIRAAPTPLSPWSIKPVRASGRSPMKRSRTKWIARRKTRTA